jgi:hypothetical protein
MQFNVQLSILSSFVNYSASIIPRIFMSFYHNHCREQATFIRSDTGYRLPRSSMHIDAQGWRLSSHTSDGQITRPCTRFH